MVKNHERSIVIILFLMDIIVVFLSWIIAHHIRYSFNPNFVPKFYPNYLILTLTFIFIFIIVFKSYGVYEIWKRNFSIWLEIKDVFKGLVISILILLTLLFFYRNFQYSRLISLIFFCISFSLLILNRIILKIFLVLNKNIRNIDYKKGLIVGKGNLGEKVEKKIRETPWLNIKIIGYIDDKKEEKEDNIIGKIKDIKDIVEKEKIDYVFITLPFKEYYKIEDITNQLSESMVSIKIIPDIYTLTTLCCGISNFIGFPMIHLTDSPLDDSWNRFIKRSFDIIFSSFVLILTSPLLLIIAIAIKLTSKGPIFYVQERMGMDGKVFKMIKFRTMKVDAEKESGPVWCKKGDTRVTKIGSFLRKTSLDELPQFWNVLKGEMSVVGPRPERPVFIEKFKKEIPKYMLRHKMKAGITGWAQVNGWRGNTSLEKRIEYDLYYIENWSLGFDIKIIFLTLFKGFINENAY